MEKEDEVFVDAEEDLTPRRSNRKRRSTAGSVPAATCKKLRQAANRAMPVERSPGTGQTGPKPGAKSPGTARRRGSMAGETEAVQGLDTGGDFWKKMGAMLQGVEGRMKEETGRVVEEKMGLAFERINDLSKRLSSTERTVDGFMGDIGEIVGKKVEEHMQRRGPEPVMLETNKDMPSYAKAVKTSVLVEPARVTRTPSDDYWKCRHALRMRPIGEGDAALEVRKYIKNYLGQDDSFIEDLGHIHVQRIPSGPGARIKKEAIVTFSTVDARDAVKGAARNLAGRGQDYGIRHEVPNHLKSDLRALHSLSYHLKQKHPEARSPLR